MLMQNFGGISKEYYGIFESGLLFCTPMWPTFKASLSAKFFAMVISSNFNMNENWFS